MPTDTQAPAAEAAPEDEQIQDAEVVAEEDLDEATPPAAPEPSTELVIREGSTALIEAASPAEKVEQATAIATALDDLIKAQGLRTKVGRGKVVAPDGSEKWVDRYHVNVEGWQTLATFLDVVTHVAWSRRVRDESGRIQRSRYTVNRTVYPKGKGQGKPAHDETIEIDGYSWEAKVVAVRNGVVVGEAEAMCSREEQTWRERDDYALRSMAQTRATSKAIAAAARWIVTLAGYSGTPTEEMPAPGPGNGEPDTPEHEHGKPVDEASRKAILKAIAATLETTPEAEEAAAVVKALEETFGYFSVPMARALYELAAARHRKVNPRREADAAQGAAEEADPAAPDTSDLPPAENAVGPDDPTLDF